MWGGKNHASICLFTVQIRPRGYKTFFMLISTEYEISTAHEKLKYRQMKTFLVLSVSDVVFIMLINVKMPFNIYGQDKFRA